MRFTSLSWIMHSSAAIDYQFTCHLQHIDCWFDAQQMEKVFFNLLSNAFKYTPDNGTIEIIVTATDDICIELKEQWSRDRSGRY